MIPGLFNGLDYQFPPSEPSGPSQQPTQVPVGSPVDGLVIDATRPSRASSIVSTRTGITIGTLQDDSRSARSVDITLGRRLFHINRDASKISVSDGGELPPYSLAAPAYAQHAESMDGVPSDGFRTPPGTSPHSQQSRLATDTAGPSSRSASMPPTPRASSCLDVNAVEDREATVWRSPSFNPGPDRITVIPKKRSVSQGNIPDGVNLRRRLGDGNPRLCRRNGVRLPKLYTSGLSNGNEDNLPGSRSLSVDATSPDTLTVQSAGPSFGLQEFRRPRSPNYIGKDEAGMFSGHSKSHEPSTQGEVLRLLQLPSQSCPSLALAIPESPAHIDEGDVRTHSPPAMDSENDISIHYSRLIRSIDHDHRKALHCRDKELAAMRERLNEVDQIYRQVLKARDFTIDDLQKRLTNLESEMQTRVDKAQNEIEDQWEVRWKHRDRQLVERMRRIEIESQRQIERTVAQRDEEWVAELQKQNRDLLSKLGVEDFKSPPAGD